MKNYKLTIQYDGAGYAGWQRQENAPTVQQAIEDSLSTILRNKTIITGSGRTDTGVHALGQVANFRTEKELNIPKVNYSLNSLLPADISVTSMTEVHEDFHSRFDAKKRSYIYLISKTKSPFYFNYALYNPFLKTEEVNKLNGLSKVLLGEHDFTSFSRKNTETNHNRCFLYDLKWRESGSLIICFIEANRFLHGMVRAITGTLLYLVRHSAGEKELEDILNVKNRDAAAESVKAKGLFLYKVKY